MRLTALVQERMDAPRRGADRVTRRCDGADAVDRERHGPGKHLEPLLLRRMNVRGDVCTLRRPDLELQQLTVRVRGGLPEADALPAGGVMDDLRHGPSFCAAITY